MKEPKTKLITFRVTNEEKDMIDKAVKTFHLTKTDIIVLAIKDFINKNV